MSCDSHIYDSIKEPDSEDMAKESDKNVTDAGHEVDIKAFFDAEKSVNEKLECETTVLPNESVVSGHYLYDAENAANREQRHINLRQIRLNRGISTLLILLILLFFVGLLGTVIGTVFMRNQSSEWKNRREQDLSAEALVDERSMRLSIESDRSVEDSIDLTLGSTRLSQDFNDSNQLNELSTTVSKLETMATTTTQKPSTSSVEEFERQLLEDMAPDSSIQHFLERLQRTRSDLRLEDIPSALDEFFTSFRQAFKIPRIAIRFQ